MGSIIKTVIYGGGNEISIVASEVSYWYESYDGTFVLIGSIGSPVEVEMPYADFSKAMEEALSGKFFEPVTGIINHCSCKE